MKGLVGLYLFIAFIVAVYGNWWGDYAFRGFAWNFGRALVWPVIMFPSLGQIIGGIVLVGGAILLLALKR